MVAPPWVLLRHPHRLLSLSSLIPASPLSPSQLAPAPGSTSFFPRRQFRCSYSTLGGRPPAWKAYSDTVWPQKLCGGGGARRAAEEGEGRGHWWRAKRRWWSDETYDDEWEEDDDDFDFLDGDFEQPWEKIWIFKVFKSYGYFLPAIIASMLLATGPKAFLMALALPLGQSALSLAIDKLWGNASRERRPRPKTKKKPFARSAGDFRREDDEEEIGRGYQDRKAYQSWMAADAAASNREAKSPAFGGWDELDRRKEYAGGPASQQPSKNTSSSSPRGQPVRERKLSRRERNKDVPLFLRLLIAVFPFLGSWTRIL